MEWFDESPDNMPGHVLLAAALWNEKEMKALLADSIELWLHANHNALSKARIRRATWLLEVEVNDGSTQSKDTQRAR
jgi:hypothetical protein